MIQRLRWAAPAMLALGCSAGPVQWDERVRNTVGPPAQPTVEARIAGACDRSIRVTRDSSGTVFAVWWAKRPDSTAVIKLARSRDGRVFGPPITIDSVDVGRTGCGRLPPAIAVDGRNVYVAYAMRAPEGPGIFSSHSMDGGSLFHSPVAVVYGERLGRVAVAAHGNLVAVAYEDPNTRPTRISLALSVTMAHLFEYRQVVSPPGVWFPDVGVSASSVRVSWIRTAFDGTPFHEARSGRVTVPVATQ